MISHGDVSKVSDYIVEADGDKVMRLIVWVFNGGAMSDSAPITPTYDCRDVLVRNQAHTVDLIESGTIRQLFKLHRRIISKVHTPDASIQR
jgi:hypothetical protein